MKRLLLKVVTLYPRSRAPIGTGPISVCRLTYSMTGVRDYWIKIGSHEVGKTARATIPNRYYHPRCGVLGRHGLRWKPFPLAAEIEMQPPWR